ncbi:MAG: protein kinase domain-containing protein [Planctomycetota bacterium]|jgi:serine/threonine protein kinase
MPILVIEKGKDKGQTVRLEKGKAMEAGRGQLADMRLRDSMTSRKHFRIEPFKADWYITDLGSSNGTLVNGKRIDTRTRLEYGDTILAGDILMTYAADEEAGETLGVPGTAIAGYIIERRVGRGGMGTVYKALQVSLDRPVALKVLSKELVQDKNFINMFIREARAAGQLNHPNIVQVYDVGSSDGIYYFSMEYVGGGSIEDLINRDGRLPVHEALKCTIDSARGLEYAKKRGLVHRDIKPDNLMLTDDEVIKIGDLGIARTMQEGVVSQKEGVSGSPHYMAPEQAQGLDIDHRADIYGLGVSVFQMLTGRTPYLGSSPREIILKQINEPAPSIRSINPEVPQEVCGVVEKMMAKDRAKRYQSASELLEDLLELQRHFPEDGTMVEHESFNWKKLIAPGIIIGAAVLAALITYYLLTGYIKSSARIEDMRKEFRKKLDEVRLFVEDYERSGNIRKLRGAKKKAENLWEKFRHVEDHEEFTQELQETRDIHEDIEARLKQIEREETAKKAAGEYGVILQLVPRDLTRADYMQLTEAKRQLEDFMKNPKYRPLTIWGDAELKLEAIKRELRQRAEFQNDAKDEFNRLEKDIKRHLDVKRYAEALKACRNFPEKFREIKSIAAKRDARESEIIKIVREEIKRKLEDIKKLLDKGQLEQALSRVTDVEQEFADPAYGVFNLKISDKKREIEALIRKRDTDATHKLRQNELSHFNKALSKASAYVKQHNFREAGSPYKLEKPWLKTDEFKDKFITLIEAMDRLSTLKTRLVQVLNGSLKGTRITLGNYEGIIQEADNYFIKIKGPAGMVDPVPWDKLSIEDFLKIARFPDLKPGNALALAIYLNEVGDKKLAAGQAGRAINRDRTLRKFWQDYLSARSTR